MTKLKLNKGFDKKAALSNSFVNKPSNVKA
jgi:hypothetical protein